MCPDFLQNLNAKDVGILSTPDADYHMLTWAEVRQTVAANRLDAFQRVPSELRRYLAYIWQLRLDHGSVLNFVRTRRIAWPEPAAPEGRPFECDADVKVLWNDWPYGIDKRIVHLVVWTKFDLAEDPATGDLSDQARKEIDDYVQKTFCSVLPKESVSEASSSEMDEAVGAKFRASRLFGSRIGRH